MKRFKVSVNILLLTLSIILTSTYIDGGSLGTDFTVANGIWSTSNRFTVNNKSVTFTTVWCDLNNPQIRIETALANGTVGSTSSLGGIVASVSDDDGLAYAGLSGTNIDYSADDQPLGTIVLNGEPVNINNGGSTFSINADNDVSFDQISISALGSIDGLWTTNSSFEALSVNHFSKHNKSYQLFTPLYDGPTPAHDFTSIKVVQGIISSVTTGGFSIPDDGFLILVPSFFDTSDFGVGDRVNYNFQFRIDDYESYTKNPLTAQFDSVRSAIGTGVRLVSNGQVVNNFTNQGIVFNLPTNKVTTRSLIGVNSSGYLAMASVDNVNLSELAQVAKQLKLTSAMEVNNGPCSSLYYNKGYENNSDFAVGNAIVIKKLYNLPINVTLNKKPIFFDSEPYLNTKYNRTLVPLRKIAEVLGAEVGWDQNTKSVLLKRYDTNLKLRENSKTVYVNGQARQMEVPMIIRNDRSYVPIRFITEYFGGSVYWNKSTRTVELSITTLDLLFKAADDYLEKGYNSQALAQYKEIIEIDPTNYRATKAIAMMYSDVLGKTNDAIEWYEKVIILKHNDEDSLLKLGWLNASLGLMDDSIFWYETYTKYYQDNPDVYYGLGLSYASFQKRNTSKAIENFKKAIELGLEGSEKTYAENYIKNN